VELDQNILMDIPVSDKQEHDRMYIDVSVSISVSVSVPVPVPIPVSVSVLMRAGGRIL